MGWGYFILLEHKSMTRLPTMEDIEMKSGIYQIKNLTNNKIYIGSSVDIRARWAGHRSDLKNKKHHSKHLQRSWELHGSDAFEFTILEVVKDSELLLEREQHYLDTLRPYESETKKGHKHSEETKRKIGISQKGKHISDETRKKQSISAKKRWKRPDACTEETRKKMSEAHKGKKSWNKGIKTPQEVKDKISKTLKGRPSPMKGKKHSEETKRLMSEARSGENNVRSIMTWEKVREIRRLYAAGGISQQKLADQFGCSKGCIKHILKNRSWREQ